MTLSTHMWVTNPVGHDQLWTVGRELIHTLSERDGPAEFIDAESRNRPGQRTRFHKLGQGFCAIYEMDYHPAGRLIQDGTVVHDRFCEGGCTPSDHPHEDFAAYAGIRLDTPYGFAMDHNGQRWGCGDLHAAIVGTLGSWCDERGIGWRWLNEFTGEVHIGRDGLDELGPAGSDAREWLLAAVLPAVAAAHSELTTPYGTR